MRSARSVREPAVSGMFYPAHPRSLRRDIQSMLEDAVEHLPEWRGRIIGAVVPHAGYQYSGPTAAVGYKALASQDVDTVVLVGPSHREHFNTSSVYPGDAWATPLGEIPVNAELAREIIGQSDRLIASHSGHRDEHALEVQLPFLQCLWPSVRVVAITMGEQSPERCIELARVLGATCTGQKTLLLASSDLSHYHPYAEAVRLDDMIARRIRSYEPELLLEDMEQDLVEACGGGPLVAVMMASRVLGASVATVVHRCNSGDVTGDHSSVVGYLSAIFTTP